MQPSQQTVSNYCSNCSDLALTMSQNQMACFTTFSHHYYKKDERAKPQNTNKVTTCLLPNELSAPEFNSRCKLQPLPILIERLTFLRANSYKGAKDKGKTTKRGCKRMDINW
jgi:hypothetical protein